MGGKCQLTVFDGYMKIIYTTISINSEYFNVTFTA